MYDFSSLYSKFICLYFRGLIADMKVGKKPNRQNRAASQIRFDDDGRGYTQDRSITGELDGIRRR